MSEFVHNFMYNPSDGIIFPMQYTVTGNTISLRRFFVVVFFLKSILEIKILPDVQLFIFPPLTNRKSYRYKNTLFKLCHRRLVSRRILSGLFAARRVPSRFMFSPFVHYVSLHKVIAASLQVRIPFSPSVIRQIRCKRTQAHKRRCTAHSSRQISSATNL